MLRLYRSLSEGNSSPDLGQALTGDLLLNQDASGYHWKQGRVAEAESLCDTGNETVLTHGGGTCLRCHPYYEPGRRRTSEQRCVKPLVKLVWLWDISTVLRGKVTSRVFCPSAPVVGRRGRLSVWWCGARVPFLREGRLQVLTRRSGSTEGSPPRLPVRVALARWLISLSWCEESGLAVQEAHISKPGFLVDAFTEGDLLLVPLEMRVPSPGRNVPKDRAVVGPSIPFSCFCQWKGGCVDETSSWKD